MTKLNISLITFSTKRLGKARRITTNMRAGGTS